MSNKDDTTLILEFINQFLEAISLLNLGVSNGKSYPNQAIYLLLICIDQLGWLSSPEKFSEGEDFKNWLNTYLDFRDLNCSADDLWVARCGLLHMGLPYSKYFNENKHFQIAWYSNSQFTVEEIKLEESMYNRPTKMVNVNTLFANFEKALDRFFYKYGTDENLRAMVEAKLKERPILNQM